MPVPWLLLLFLFPASLYGQADKPFPFHRIEFLGSEQGFDGGEVYRIMQDHHGFIWIISDNALNRYDGYHFRSYNYNPEDPHTLNAGWYWGMVEDTQGKLWIASQEAGMYSFDPYMEKWTHFRRDSIDSNSLQSDQSSAITKDDYDHIWLGLEDGIQAYDLKTGRFTFYPTLAMEPDEAIWPVDLIINPHQPSLMWIYYNNGDLECFNVKSRTIIKHVPFYFSDYIFGQKLPPQVNIRPPAEGNYWYGSDDDGFFGYNTYTEKPLHLRFHRPCHTPYHVNGYYGILEDRFGNLWSVNDNNEIIYYDKASNQFHFLPIKGRNIQFVEFGPYLFMDNTDKLWIATNSGLITIDTRQKNIRTYRHDPNDPFTISGDFVFSILRTHQGEFLVGTTDEVDRFDPVTGKFSRMPLIYKGKQIDAYSAWSFYQDKKETVWIAGNFGLASYDPFTKKAKQYFLHNQQGKIEMTGTVGIVEDHNGQHWVSIWNTGLHKFDPETEFAKSYVYNSEPNSLLPTNSISPMYLTPEGLIYISSWEKGLIVFDPAKETSKLFQHDAGDSTSLSNDTAHGFIDLNGYHWMATVGGGINVFDPKTEKFIAFTTEDGLVHNYVVSLTLDKKGRLWAGTRGGLSCFNPPMKPFDPDCRISFRNYDMSDGLPSNILNHLSAFCDIDGTLYFGTRNAGMFSFHPDSLEDNDFIPNVYITDLSILNKPVYLGDQDGILDSTIEFTRELHLRYSQNIISFTFAALNFIQPEKNKYAYKLEGYDEDWIYTDASKRFASYTNLDAGEYTFKVKASNNDGVWNETPTELKLFITPPFWATAWFRLLTIVLIGSGIYALYKFRLNQILQVQSIRNKIAHDLHDNIGSTLNSISIYSEVAQNKSAQHIPELDLIGEGSRKVIESMSDIVWTINPDNDSFEKIIFRMRSLTHSLMAAKNIEYTFKVDDKLNSVTLPMHTRRQFYLIYKEAVNNLLKYSNATRASISLNYDRDEVEMLIHDNGVGFDTSNPPRGNGLKSMRSRAEDIKAYFAIDSSPGQGTTIELNFHAK